MNNFDLVIYSILQPSNIIFSFSIVIIVFVGMYLAIANRADNCKRFMPSLAVSIGIFGTFWGIFIGLSGFDTSNISKSIPIMLEGMKTAFITSILGMLASIILKIIYAIIEDKNSKYSSDPLKCLQNIEVGINQQIDSIQRLEKSIGNFFNSDNSYSFLSQVALIRSEITITRNEIMQAFQTFANEFSKMASESLVDELRKVVDKFNAMLSDLVGQSFRALKDSTDRLNSWQEQYKSEMSTNFNNISKLLTQFTSLNNIYAESINQIEKLFNELSNISNSLNKISISGAELDLHAQSISQQNAILDASINAIKDAGEKAANVVPEISKKIDFILNNIDKMNKDISTFVVNTTNQLENNAKEISKTSQLQIESIEKSLETELKKSMDSFAGVMVALSTKFASDYSPLTDKLRDILTIAQRINNVSYKS